jgi:hypothetical protein
MRADGPVSRFSNLRPQATANDVMNNPIYEAIAEEVEPIQEYEEQGGAASKGGASAPEVPPQPGAAPAAVPPAVLPTAPAAAAAPSPPQHESMPEAQPRALDGAAGAAPAAALQCASTDSDAGEWAVADAHQLTLKGVAPHLHTTTSASRATSSSSPDAKAHAGSLFTYPSARALAGEHGAAAAGSPKQAMRSIPGTALPPANSSVVDQQQVSHDVQPVRAAARGPCGGRVG